MNLSCVTRLAAAPARHPLTASPSFRRLCSAPSVALPLPLRHPHPPTTVTTTCADDDRPRDNSNLREQTLLSLFDSCSTIWDLSQIHAQIIQSGFHQHVFVVGRIISFCSVSEAGFMDYAAKVFQGLAWPDGFLWNTMIRGFGRTGRSSEAFLYYRRMQEDGKPANNFTFSFLLKLCAQLVATQLGMQVHCCTVKRGLDSHIYVRNTLIHMYAMFGEMTTARRLFDEIPDQDLVAWNTVIDGYVQCGEHREALGMFLRMIHGSGFRPDDATLVVVLSACSELGALDFGRWVHSLIRGSRFEQFVAASNSLVDMYSKCGAIDQALDVFESMKERNVVSWNSMILGLAMHGHATEALQLFARMQEHWGSIEPNDITFLGVLCACSHGGLVEQGKMYFDSMRDYHITPTIQHYGCMTDLLGRAGLVWEAYELIRGMPMECNAVVWRTLLSACRVHGDVELGERVRRHLLELEPGHSSDYVLLSQMYASAERWQDMLSVRESMRGRGVQKPEPGNSLTST